MASEGLNVLSLFDGCSCGQLALDRAGIKVNKYYASEIDKYAIQITQKNYPNTIQLGDIYNIDYNVLPKIDLIIGGSPCTYWSISKKDREITSEGIGFDLFMQYVKAIRLLKPKYFLYENNHSIHKDIKEAITKELGVEYIMINSSLLSAQQRKRCYWTNIPNITQPQDKGILLKDIILDGTPYQNKSHCITASYDGVVFWNSIARKQRTMIPVRVGHFGKGGQGQRIYSVQGKSVCIMSSGGGQGLYKIDLPDGDYIVRKLTPVEVERLQTMPDNYTEGVFNTQRYKMVGNGWTIDVITYILKHIEKVGE
jgi:DNA (cytosine-5)-methyltransferase 3A